MLLLRSQSRLREIVPICDTQSLDLKTSITSSPAGHTRHSCGGDRGKIASKNRLRPDGNRRQPVSVIGTAPHNTITNGIIKFYFAQ